MREPYAHLARTQADFRSVWLNSLLVPAYLTAFSVLIISLHLISNTKLAKKIYARLFSSETDKSEESSLDTASSPVHSGLCADLRQHVISLGGIEIFVFRVLRLVSCVALLAFTITSLILEKREDSEPSQFTLYGKHWGKKHPHQRDASNKLFTKHEWLHVALALTYVGHISLCVASFKAYPRFTRQLWLSSLCVHVQKLQKS